jgi:filamentous hemagglutinin family protein
MRREIFYKRFIATVLCLLFFNSNVFALNAATDLIDHTSGVNPTTSGNVTNITTTHNIDTYHWSSYSLGANETANYIFTANGQTALNYLSPGANASLIYGAITGSGASGNILLFNPNGIMMGGGASVSGANTFFASTNKFDGIVNGKVTFSEAEKNNPLVIGNIKFNDVNNVHFVPTLLVLRQSAEENMMSIQISFLTKLELKILSLIQTYLM